MVRLAIFLFTFRRVGKGGGFRADSTSHWMMLNCSTAEVFELLELLGLPSSNYHFQNMNARDDDFVSFSVLDIRHAPGGEITVSFLF